MKRHAPASERNREPIADILLRELPCTGLVLEVASGTGEHAVFLAERFPKLEWVPSDADPTAMASIAAWRQDCSRVNLREPLLLDVTSKDWPLDRADAVLCINMVHISPWAATRALFAGSKRLLESGLPLILYGPYFEQGIDSAPSNLDFDRSLRERDPRWGVRSVEDMDALARQNHFTRTARQTMPANNLMLVYRLD